MYVFDERWEVGKNDTAAIPLAGNAVVRVAEFVKVGHWRGAWA